MNHIFDVFPTEKPFHRERIIDGSVFHSFHTSFSLLRLSIGDGGASVNTVYLVASLPSSLSDGKTLITRDKLLPSKKLKKVFWKKKSVGGGGVCLIKAEFSRLR